MNIKDINVGYKYMLKPSSVKPQITNSMKPYINKLVTVSRKLGISVNVKEIPYIAIYPEELFLVETEWDD